MEKKIGKTSDYIIELSDIAFLQLEIEKYSESEKNFLICLEHFKRQLDRLGQAAVLGILGTLYFKKGQYKSSIYNYLKAYEIYEELKQIEEVITCLKGIGNSYIKLNQLDKACDIYLDCSEVCSENNDIYNLLDCLGNLIQINENQERWDIVFELYKKALKAFKELNDDRGIIITYYNLGILQKKFNKLEKSLGYFKKGTNIAINSSFAELILKGLSYIGEIFVYQGKIKDAKNEYIKALKLAKKVNAKNAMIQLRILLNSIGLSDTDIEKELDEI
ncbi:MAG: tetratricopeptide repeat protein [Promethearchaeota archaeon]